MMHESIVLGMLKVLEDHGIEFVGSVVGSEGINYNEQGFSPFSTFGGVRIALVDAMLDKMIASGAPNQKRVAESFPRFATFMHREVDYQPDTENQILANQGRLFFAGDVDDFYSMAGNYKHKKTGEEIFGQLTFVQRFSGNWERIGNRLKGRVGNHLVVANGNNSMIEHPGYDAFIKSIPARIKSHFYAEVALLDTANTRI